jgi:hypothetical protein
MSTQISPTAHHALGPSKFPMLAECIDFESEKEVDIDDLDADMIAAIEEDAPKVHGNDAKGRGTAQHEALAKALTGQPNAFDGLSHREEQQVRWVIEDVVTRAAAYGFTADEIRVEQRVSVLWPDFREAYFGTLDIEYGPVIEDAKFGDMRNFFPQLAGYALGKMERDEIDRVFARTTYGRWRKTQQYVIDRTTAETVVFSLLRRRQSPDRRPTLCQYCGWCAKNGTCSAVTGVVDTIASKRSDWAMRLPTAHISQAPNDPVTLGAMRYLWKSYIEPWGSSVEFASQSLAERGIIPLGFKRQNEKGRAEFEDGDAVAQALMRAGVEPARLFSAAKFGLKKLSLAYHAQFGGTKVGAERRVEEILIEAGVIKRGEAGFKLIRVPTAEDDIRMALARPVQEDQPSILAGQ